VSFRNAKLIILTIECVEFSILTFSLCLQLEFSLNQSAHRILSVCFKISLFLRTRFDIIQIHSVVPPLNYLSRFSLIFNFISKICLKNSKIIES